MVTQQVREFQVFQINSLKKLQAKYFNNKSVTCEPNPKNIQSSIFIPQLAPITGTRNIILKFKSSYSSISTASSRLDIHRWTS